ncbi:MAG: putative translation initiation inhibitor [Bacillales bacterium]|jgi:2-iminobutanoate/2-iminopropanoate deaminase|nr:putative translation initiation inhibitor [Bacillales bacterium]
MEKEILSIDKAPKAVGPYSQAVKFNNLIFASGQVAFVPETGELLKDNIKVATRQTLENIKTLLNAHGLGLEKVVKTTIFLKNIDDYGEMNEVYSEYFPENSPARTAVAVSNLPLGALVEIEIIAHE